MTGIICLEGPDAAGKTTLAKYFKDHHGAHVIHATYRFKKNVPTYHLQQLLEAVALSQRGKLVILDRNWISECIYAEVFRGGHKWPSVTRRMHRLFEKLSVLTILCLPMTISQGCRMHELNLDEAHPYSSEKFVEVIAGYLELWEGAVWETGENFVQVLARRGGVQNDPFYMR